MRTSTPNRRPTGMDQLRISILLLFYMGSYIDCGSRRSKSHAGDRGEISKPAAAFVARDGYSPDVRPFAGNVVQCADRGESGGAGRQRVAGPIRGDGRGGNRGPEPRSEGSLFRGVLDRGGGRNPQKPAEPWHCQRIQASAGRIAATHSGVWSGNAWRRTWCLSIRRTA